MKKYQAVYAGKRLIGKKLWRLFIRSDNQEEMFFKRVRAVSVGSTYECQAASISSRPKWLPEVPRVDNPQWEAADEIATSEFKALKQKAKAIAALEKASKPNLEKAIEALIPLCKDLDWVEINKFMTALADKVDRRLDKTKKQKRLFPSRKK